MNVTFTYSQKKTYKRPSPQKKRNLLIKYGINVTIKHKLELFISVIINTFMSSLLQINLTTRS